MPRIPAEQRPAIARFIAPAAPFWFRWGAVWPVVTGLILAWLNGHLGSALKLGIVTVGADEARRAGRIAGPAFRTNTMLSIPMLYAMASAGHYF